MLKFAYFKGDKIRVDVYPITCKAEPTGKEVIYHNRPGSGWTRIAISRL